MSINSVNIQTMFHRKLIYSYSDTKYDRPAKVEWLSWLVFHSKQLTRFIGGGLLYVYFSGWDCLRWWEMGISIFRWGLDYISGEEIYRVLVVSPLHTMHR